MSDSAPSQLAKTLINSRDSTFDTVVKKAYQLLHLNDTLCNHLPDYLVPHIRIANFENSLLTIAADSSTWATKIRYMIPDLIKTLKQKNGFKNLKNIRCIIQPLETKLKQKNKMLKLSTENVELLKSIANNTTDEKLKEALIKLAKNSISDS